MTKRAFISVWNKDKIVEFAQEITEKYNYEIISVGSTYDLLKENNIKVEKINNVSEVLESINNIESPLDIAVVNLYPFE